METRRRGVDVTWSLPLSDGTTTVPLSTLLDYEIRVIYFVGDARKIWLTYKKTPVSPELEIFSANTYTMRIVLPHDKTNTGPIGALFAQVKVVKTDASGGYPSSQNWITVLDSNTGNDLHPICIMEREAS